MCSAGRKWLLTSRCQSRMREDNTRSRQSPTQGRCWHLSLSEGPLSYLRKNKSIHTEKMGAFHSTKILGSRFWNFHQMEWYLNLRVTCFRGFPTRLLKLKVLVYINWQGKRCNPSRYSCLFYAKTFKSCKLVLWSNNFCLSVGEICEPLLYSASCWPRKLCTPDEFQHF